MMKSAVGFAIGFLFPGGKVHAKAAKGKVNAKPAKKNRIYRIV